MPRGTREFGNGHGLRIAPAILLALFFLARGVSATAQSSNEDSLIPWASLSFAGLCFVDSDMESTYGIMPAFGLRFGLGISEDSEFILGMLYGSDSGDPYHGVPGFSAGNVADLRTVPIEAGMRLNVLHNSKHKFYVGLAAQYVWIEEKIPGVYAQDGGEKPAYSGWGWGLRLLTGPEWRLSGGRLAVGAEFSVGGRGVSIKSGAGERTADLSGLTSRVYISVLF